jgi:hypothetical protein
MKRRTSLIVVSVVGAVVAISTSTAGLLAWMPYH